MSEEMMKNKNQICGTTLLRLRYHNSNSDPTRYHDSNSDPRDYSFFIGEKIINFTGFRLKKAIRERRLTDCLDLLILQEYDGVISQSDESLIHLLSLAQLGGVR